MTNPTRQEPGAPAFHVLPVLAGQPLTTVDGDTTLSHLDGVQLSILDPIGHPMMGVLFDPDTALTLAVILQRTAIQVQSHEIDDDGRPRPLTARLARLNAAFHAADTALRMPTE